MPVQMGVLAGCLAPAVSHPIHFTRQINFPDVEAQLQPRDSPVTSCKSCPDRHGYRGRFVARFVAPFGACVLCQSELSGVT